MTQSDEREIAEAHREAQIRLRPPRSPVIYNPSPPSQDHAGRNQREKKTRGEGDCCKGDEGHGGWLGENRGLLGERESKGGEQTREIFWKMVYGNFFRKPFSFFSFAFLR